MPAIDLYPHQLDAVRKLDTGKILVGGTGSGKSRTALAYYYFTENGQIDKIREGFEPSSEYVKMLQPRDLYIITTPKKRDTLEWNEEMRPFLLHPDNTIYGLYSNRVVVDSWNNIKKYKDVRNAFFIFDEQRVVGHGSWVKSFLAITKKNDWILLSATPGDRWEDYTAVFIANGFFRNQTEYRMMHFEYDRFAKYPKIIRYHNEERLVRLRRLILVPMDFERETQQHHIDIVVDYPKSEYNETRRNSWNYDKEQPIETASELCVQLRRIVNRDPSRVIAVLDILDKSPRAIIFYNYDFELNILKEMCEDNDIYFAQYNGHGHDALPLTEPRWVYCVQYNAGSEGWNCIYTDTIIFFSESYSYKIMTQASGRIDRMNTPYKNLYYYHLISKSVIDMSIRKAITTKKLFNESAFVGKYGKKILPRA